METLTRRIAAKVLKTGRVELADIERLRAYAYKHPMWRCVAKDQVRAAYDALIIVR